LLPLYIFTDFYGTEAVLSWRKKRRGEEGGRKKEENKEFIFLIKK
jgi:hypothetical protein